MTTLSLRVVRARALAPLIRELELQSESGAALPPFEAGAHVRVAVRLPDGSTDWRHYSLVELTGQASALQAPRHYTIAVRREDSGRGGSRFMHADVREDDVLQVQSPHNGFPLQAATGRVVLLAGGIGVTPIATMAAQARARGVEVRMTYAGRDRASMAYLEALQALLGDALTVHADDEAGRPLDVATVLDALRDDEALHVCGPQAMLDAVLAGAAARGWPRERIRFELFNAPVSAVGDQPFDVVLAQTGATLTVPADQTLLDCLIAHGCDPVFDCKRGECGVCAASVLEGEVDHRDYVLSESEKRSNTVIQICVSRARGARIVLDL